MITRRVPRRHGAWRRWTAGLGLSVSLVAAASASSQLEAPSAATSQLPSGLQQVAAVASLGECVNLASQFHQVNPWVLTAILRHESGLRANAVVRNSNGSVDAGIGQVNSVHWPLLARYGISPNDLLNPCVGTFVAGWHLAEQIRRFGNTWFAVGAYHSRTASFNARYQVHIWNQLVELGAVQGRKISLPR